MRAAAALCLVGLALVAGCGGSDDRPDLASPPTTTEADAPAPTTLTTTQTATQSVTSVRTGTHLRSGERSRIAEQANVADSAVQTWNRTLNSCIGPSGTGDDTGATCTRAAWGQLFDQMYSVRYELLALVDRIGAGACHEALSSAIDAAHGFLAGATPLNLVWLDDQQRPPSLFDLEAIVDVARPLPARLREAESTCAA